MESQPRCYARALSLLGGNEVDGIYVVTISDSRLADSLLDK